MSMALQQATQGLPEAQRAPISGGPDFASTMPRAAWSPTPPQSWSGNQRSHARSLAPPPHMPPAVHQTTVSASSGQLQTQPTQAKPSGGSKKGLVIALLALVLVGGGIAAAVTFGGGDGSQQVAANDPPATTPTTPPTAQPTPSAPHTPPAPVRPAAKADDDDDTDFDKEMAKVQAQVEQQTNDALKQAQQTTADRLADAKAKLEKAGIKTKIAQDPLAEAAESALGGGAPSGSSGGPNTSGWFDRHPVSPPSRAWSKIDIGKHVEWAIAEAKRNVPDAQLTRIDVARVRGRSRRPEPRRRSVQGQHRRSLHLALAREARSEPATWRVREERVRVPSARRTGRFGDLRLRHDGLQDEARAQAALFGRAGMEEGDREEARARELPRGGSHVHVQHRLAIRN